MFGASIGHGDVVGKWVSNAGVTGAAAYWAHLVVLVFVPSALLSAVVGMITFYTAGPMAERVYGNGNFLFIYLLSGLAGALASAQWHGSVGPPTTSGAFFGLIGAFLAYFMKSDNIVPKTVASENRVLAFFLLGWNVVLGIPAGVDYVASVAALVIGFVLGYALGRPLEAPGPQVQ